MISERTLRKWRKEALEAITNTDEPKNSIEFFIVLEQRIIQLTQELMDQHLLRQKK
ncbi:MAG: hypothetical protein WC554_04230 [Clostridia bacterium]